MDKEQGLKQINEAKWVQGDGCLDMLVNDIDGRVVNVWLAMRPAYCDRGHVQLNIDGPLQLDRFDSFPRYFFSFEEADAHARAFLKWRLWRERTYSNASIQAAFKKAGS
jgi:hypothetical protein